MHAVQAGPASSAGWPSEVHAAQAGPVSSVVWPSEVHAAQARPVSSAGWRSAGWPSELHAVQAGPVSSADWPSKRLPTGLQAMLEQFVDSPRLMGPKHQAPPPAFRIGTVLPPKPLLVMQLHPALRGSHPVVVTDGEAHSMLVGHAKSTMRDFPLWAGVCFLALAGSVLSSLLLLSRCAGKVEARTPQIRTLAEPLAPAPAEESPAALPAANVRRGGTPSPAPTRKYLLDVYARAQTRIDLSVANAERKGIQQYLCELYGRTA